MLKHLDRKPPIYTVALLVAVACEVLAKVLPDAGDAKEIFAREFAGTAPRAVGRDIYDVMRNGLAHSYDPYPIDVGNSTVYITFAWKGGPHLRVIGLRRRDGHNHVASIERNEFPHRYVCVVVEALYHDLVSLFDRWYDRLRADPILAERVAESSSRIRERKQPQGEARQQWEEFLESAALHEEELTARREGEE